VCVCVCECVCVCVWCGWVLCVCVCDVSMCGWVVCVCVTYHRPHRYVQRHAMGLIYTNVVPKVSVVIFLCRNW